MATPLKASALFYAAKGWFVFPLAPHDKRPLAGTRGLLEATTDRSQIIRWWDAEPEANIGVATGPSGLCVIDIDPRHGGDDSWFALARDKAVPETLTVLTAGGGQHFYFSGGLEPTTVHGLASGIDTRAAGGYVVAPPSVNGEGAWKWEVTHGPRDGGILQPLPEWLALALTQKSNRALDLSQDTPVIEGGRNHWLTRVAGRLRRLGLTPVELQAALEGVNQQRCRPPLPSREIASIAKSIGVREAQEAAALKYDNPDNLGLMSYSELKAATGTAEPWLVDSLLRASGLLLLAGKPGAGKSTLARNLARSVASGSPFLGRPCRQGLVLWVGLEETAGELEAALVEIGAIDLPIKYRIESFHNDQERWLRSAVEHLEPALVVVDTVGTFTGVEDANNYSQVVKATKIFLELRNKYGTSFLLNHHTNKSNHVLGSTYWEGFVDHVLVLTANEDDGTRFVRTTKKRGNAIPIEGKPLDLDYLTRPLQVEDPGDREELLEYAGTLGLL